MHFWSVLGKIKPRNEKNRCILGLERLTLGVWGHSGAQNMDFSSFWWLVKWPLRRKFELTLRARNRFWSQMDPDPRERPFKTYFDVFLSFLGFILPETDQKCTFYAIFESKFPRCLKNDHFLHWICIKSALLVGFGQNKAQEWWKNT